MNKLIRVVMTIVKTNDLAYKGFYNDDDNTTAKKEDKQSVNTEKSALINCNN